ncbi:hypothetical protein DFH09DRAFT_1319072 [Mycena vulgaris]|nr:hypothetical protein DFH09DRAFT_1319072 [Mycena vulgaris]
MAPKSTPSAAVERARRLANCSGSAPAADAPPDATPNAPPPTPAGGTPTHGAAQAADAPARAPSSRTRTSGDITTSADPLPTGAPTVPAPAPIVPVPALATPIVPVSVVPAPTPVVPTPTPVVPTPAPDVPAPMPVFPTPTPIVHAPVPVLPAVVINVPTPTPVLATIPTVIATVPVATPAAPVAIIEVDSQSNDFPLLSSPVFETVSHAKRRKEKGKAKAATAPRPPTPDANVYPSIQSRHNEDAANLAHGLAMSMGVHTNIDGGATSSRPLSPDPPTPTKHLRSNTAGRAVPVNLRSPSPEAPDYGTIDGLPPHGTFTPTPPGGGRTIMGMTHAAPFPNHPEAQKRQWDEQPHRKLVLLICGETETASRTHPAFSKLSEAASA